MKSAVILRYWLTVFMAKSCEDCGLKLVDINFLSHNRGSIFKKQNKKHFPAH